MRVTSLKVQHTRIHHQKSVSLAGGTTIITGSNGSGKTSLLEALYVAFQGTSFKGSDGDILRTGADWWRVDVAFDDGSQRSVLYEPSKQSGKKRIIIDDKTNYRLPQRLKLPVVLFEPDDLRLLNGSPERRRRFIDTFITRLDLEYAQSLRTYERALKQRNNLLKQPRVDRDQLFSWNILLSEHGAVVTQKRIAFIEEINKKLNDKYHAIARTNDTVSLHYSHTVIGNAAQKLLRELEQSTEKDIHLGYTSVGPHRHDVLFSLNETAAAATASRGEIRTYVLALKLIEIEITADLTGTDPLVLLDDVFSELDEARQHQLTLSNYQTVITTTHSTGHDKNAAVVQLGD